MSVITSLAKREAIQATCPVNARGVTRKRSQSDVGCDSTSPDVGNYIGSRIKQVKADGAINRYKCRRQRRQMAAARRKASVCHVVILANSYIL